MPFRLHASFTCPPAADLAISLAWELADADPERIERSLDALTETTQEGDPREQLRALGQTALNARPDGELMIDRVLDRGQGHPLLVAIVMAEIGRRAGLPVGLVAGEQGHFVAHQRLTEALVLDPATGRVTDANALGTMTWRCGHQIAAELLDLLQGRFERSGDLTRALHVAHLRTTLPFDDATDTEAGLRRVTARLN